MLKKFETWMLKKKKKKSIKRERTNNSQTIWLDTANMLLNSANIMAVFFFFNFGKEVDK